MNNVFLFPKTYANYTYDMLMEKRTLMKERKHDCVEKIRQYQEMLTSIERELSLIDTMIRRK